MKYKRLSAQKHKRIIRCFCADITETAGAEIVGVNRNTGNQLTHIHTSIEDVAAVSEESGQVFNSVSNQIQETNNLVIQMKGAMDGHASDSQQVGAVLKLMKDSPLEVRTASQEMTMGNRQILGGGGDPQAPEFHRHHGHRHGGDGQGYPAYP